MTTTHPPQAPLLQQEAIHLAYALAVRAAEQVGVRVLAIKGLVASTHGLRAERTPADIDILIDPAGFTAVTDQLQAWGWRSRLGEFTDVISQHHSITYLHDQWPCDIDAHHHFPGFLHPSEDVFDALWERRELLPVAGHQVPMTDWAGSVAILALHSARSTPENPRHVSELRRLIDASPTWTQQQRTDLATLAAATGSVQSLETVWQHLNIPVDPTTEHIDPHDLAEWRLKLDGRLPGPRVWLRYIRDGGPRHIITRLGTAIWPPEAMLRASHQIPDTKTALLRVRLTRLARATRRIPRNLLAMARGGTNVIRNATDGKVGSPTQSPHPPG